MTLFTDLLTGLLGGLLLVLIIHFILAKVSLVRFFRMIFKDESTLIKQSDTQYLLELKGIVNFLRILKINKLLKLIQEGSEVTIDASETRLLGLTVLEQFYDFQTRHQSTGGTVHIIGLDQHKSSNDHHLSTKINLVES